MQAVISYALLLANPISLFNSQIKLLKFNKTTELMLRSDFSFSGKNEQSLKTGASNSNICKDDAASAQNTKNDILKIKESPHNMGE